MHIQYFWQGNYHTYGHIRCVHTVLASPTHTAKTLKVIHYITRTQFLLTESQGAVTKNVGKLARHHAQVTLMFMDIQGFTAMSKVGKEGNRRSLKRSRCHMFGAVIGMCLRVFRV